MSNSELIEQAKSKVNEKDFDGALVILNKIIETNGADIEALYERGVLYTNLKQLDLALFDFNKLIEIRPDYPFYFSCRAFIKSSLKDIKGAISDYEYAIKLDPEDAIAYNNLGLLQEQQGFKLQAEKSFEKSNEFLGYNPNRYGEGNLEKTPEENNEEPLSKSDVVKSVFTDKSMFKEFIGFIKNGFKIKKDDKS